MADERKYKPQAEDDDDDDDEIDELQYIAQKDAVLFAINVNHTMLKAPPASEDKKADTDSPAIAALKCAYQFMQQRIISSPRDMMGVLLFGTELSKFQEHDPTGRSSTSYPHCYLFTDLDIPSAADVKALKNIVHDEDVKTEVLRPSTEATSMSNMLFCANQIFTTKAPNFGSRRLFIITDDDDPHQADKKAKNVAATRAKDLYDLGVVIELFPISRQDHDFDRSQFYDDIIYRDPAIIEDTLSGQGLKSGGSGISLLSNLISDVNSKNVAKRALFANLPFEIGPNFRISVKGYNILQRQAPARSCYVWTEGEEAQIAVGESAQFAEDSTRTVRSVEIKKAYKFGGEQVLFTAEEQKELRNFGSPVLRIIGFKDRDLLPFWASVHKSTFIYPSEDDYVGSTRVFSALWRKLLDDKKMGIAWYIARANATPVLVAILPSAERVDEMSHQQVFPAGLWLCPLPFRDDVRDLGDLAQPVVASDRLIDQMRMIVQQLQLPKAMYDPRKYPNPSLQWHYKILQAMALEEEIPEKAEDLTVPKYRQIDKRAGDMINQWMQLLRDESAVSQKDHSTTIKHERHGSETGDAIPARPAKQAKSTISLEEMSGAQIKELVVNDTLSKHTVAELKILCKSKGLSEGGKKAQLVERIEQWAEDVMA